VQPRHLGRRDACGGVGRQARDCRGQPRDAPDARRQPLDRIDRLVAVDRPLAEYVHEPADAEANQIAAYVARLINDGSTLQVGVGRVANQMLAHLIDRRDLAIHSHVITERSST
jgi:acyl-CoA hydrolase